MFLDLTFAAMAVIAPSVPATGIPCGPVVLPGVGLESRVEFVGETADYAKDDCGDFVTLKTRDKLELKGTYFAPRSKGRRAPAALLVHDAGANRSQLEEFAVYLNKKGFGVLTLDLRGHGESIAGDVDWDKADPRAQETLWALSGRDLRAGADFLREQTSIHASNLTMIGYGLGCTLAVRHALDDENARTVVLLSPRPEASGFNLVNGIGELEGLPTLLIVGKEARGDGVRIQQAAHKANDGLEYVEVTTMRASHADVLNDKKLGSSTYAWLRDFVLPQK